MDQKQFKRAKVRQHDSVGPFTAEVNKLLIQSKGTPFFDYTFFQFDLYYLMYTKHIWQEQLWAHTESPIIREFRDDDMELANQ